MSLTLVSSNDLIPHPQAKLILRLADEGIPVAAIARSLQLPSETVRRAIQEDIDGGGLVPMPAHDWAPGSSREQRPYDGTHIMCDADRLTTACFNTFKTTNLQSAMLAALLRRDRCTKEQLHQVIEQERVPGKEATDIKMVDVLVCLLRKKLKSFDIPIKTEWGRGYLIEPVARNRALAHIQAGVAAKAALEIEQVPLQEAA